jgi:predicted TIM-barrel fold metal-dependent hydrolase
MAVCFHEGGLVYLPQVGGRFPQVMLHHTCTHPMEMMLAAVDIIGGGVLARFPELRVGFLEGNCSWVPFLLWRLDEHYEWRREWDAPNFTMTPTEYFKRQCFVSVDCDEEPAKYTVDWIGEGNIVFSTDYPHADAKYPEASERFLKLPLSDSAKRKIMWDNCAKLYGIG